MPGHGTSVGRGHKWGGAAFRSGISSRDAVAFASIRTSDGAKRRQTCKGADREARTSENQSRRVSGSRAPFAAKRKPIGERWLSPHRGIDERGRRTTFGDEGRIGRDAEKIPRQVRPQDPAGDQEAVHQKPQGQKVAQSQLLAHGHPGPRDDLALVVPAVPGRQEHRHVHDVRRREPGGLHVELLLLRRVRGEPEEREQGERDDNLTSACPR